jgi:hypothetical protein
MEPKRLNFDNPPTWAPVQPKRSLSDGSKQTLASLSAGVYYADDLSKLDDARDADGDHVVDVRVFETLKPEDVYTVLY